MNIYSWNLPICNSVQYIYVTGLCNFFFVPQELIDGINSYFQKIAFWSNLFLIVLLSSNTCVTSFFWWKQVAFIGMALRKLVRRNYSGKSPVSIKHENLHSFKKWVILLCHSILETRRISHLHGSVLFAIPSTFFYISPVILGEKRLDLE